MALDSGGGSFQLSFQKAGGQLEVVEGAWGSVSAATAILTAQGRSWSTGTSPNPISLAHLQRAKASILESIRSLPNRESLKAKLADASTRVVAIGGPTCMFRMVQIALGDDSLRFLPAQRVLEAISGLVDKTDEDLVALGFPQPQVLLSKLMLFCVICEELLDNRHVEYEPSNGSCPGVISASVASARL